MVAKAVGMPERFILQSLLPLRIAKKVRVTNLTYALLKYLFQTKKMWSAV